MFVEHRFNLQGADYIRSMIPKFGYNGFGELVFYRTYSRVKKDGGQESWNDVVIRVTEGAYSIRKDFYLKNHIPWDDHYWQIHAFGFAKSMFQMKWMPPGRGLWAMGSDFVYERGAMALYNCAFTELRNSIDFVEDVAWLMDTLMHGVGVGFAPIRSGLKLYKPLKGTYDFEIPDTREGWVQAVGLAIWPYIQGSRRKPAFKDHLIRGPGMPIRGFGGVSSGPEPLMKLLFQIDEQCERYVRGEMDEVEFKTNVANLVGVCVVAGNVRRSAEIACGSIHDEIFMNLKNYSLNPHREEYGWMSNNTVMLDTVEDFDQLGEIAKRVILNGEPGVANRKNMKYGRIGKYQDGCRLDRAIGFNPCGEIPLEHREVCNLSETLPTMCDGPDDWYKACEYATFYSSTVALLPTHQPSTNRVVARNRRIGVGIIDFSGWKHTHGVHKVTKWLRNGYDVVTESNRQLNAEAGVPEALRKTCVKPGGTTPKLPGKTSGCGNPTFWYTLRRIRVAANSAIHSLLVEAGIPYEADLVSANTDVFEYPILQGPAKPATEVSLWEQANTIVLLQREWADNAVSNTLYFKPMWKLAEAYNGKQARRALERRIGAMTLHGLILRKQYRYTVPETLKVSFTWDGQDVSSACIYEYDPAHEENDIEPVLSSIIPLCKSVSLLPHAANGVYAQTPEEGISKAEYEERLAVIRPIDWTRFGGSDGMDERYCQGDACEVPNLGNANRP